MADSWNDEQFAKDYAQNETNTDINWYEHHVNASSLWSLVPDSAHSILDFGCGPGDFTAQLKEKGYEVDGCDSSEAMVQLAKQAALGSEVFVWDGISAFPKEKTYDAVVSKLTLHFVPDLSLLALNLATVLSSKGSLLISVPHPIPTIAKAGNQYFAQSPYLTEIGTYNMQVTMIHWSLEDYVNPFLSTGFVLTGLIEPAIPEDIIQKYHVSEEYARLPRRLNLRFEKTN